MGSDEGRARVQIGRLRGSHARTHAARCSRQLVMLPRQCHCWERWRSAGSDGACVHAARAAPGAPGHCECVTPGHGEQATVPSYAQYRTTTDQTHDPYGRDDEACTHEHWPIVDMVSQQQGPRAPGAATCCAGGGKHTWCTHSVHRCRCGFAEHPAVLAIGLTGMRGRAGLPRAPAA